MFTQVRGDTFKRTDNLQLLLNRIVNHRYQWHHYSKPKFMLWHFFTNYSIWCFFEWRVYFTIFHLLLKLIKLLYLYVSTLIRQGLKFTHPTTRIFCILKDSMNLQKDNTLRFIQPAISNILSYLLKTRFAILFNRLLEWGYMLLAFNCSIGNKSFGYKFLFLWRSLEIACIFNFLAV
jgi:hypothetical protein